MRHYVRMLVLASVLHPAMAMAGPKEDARQHIAAASTAHELGQFDVALMELEAAFALDPQPDLKFAIGQVQVKLGRCGDAIESYRSYVASNPPPEGAAAANEAIASCEAQLAAPPAPAAVLAPAAPQPSPPPPAVVASEDAAATPRPVGILVGAKLGGIVPFDGLSPYVHGGIEVGYVLPVAGRRLAIVVSADYTRPSTSHVESDPRVMDGTYTWRLTEYELGVMATIVFRATGMVPSVVPYAGIGPRILFARSEVRDDGAPMISTTRERSTRIGIGVPLGAELRLGPGSLIGELLLQYGTLDHIATGDAHTGALTLGIGYRMIL